MVLRLSQKLAKKIGVKASKVIPIDPNPLADWTGHLFSAERTRYIILTNIASLYSAVFFGRGVIDGGRLLERGLATIREVMVDDGLGFIDLRLVAPSTGSVTFAKSLNRSVTGSINELVNGAKHWLTEGELSPYDASLKLNETLMSAIGYANPREALKSLRIGQDAAGDLG